MTKEQKAEITFLTKTQQKIRSGKIPYQAMTSWSRNNDEGYNDGLEACAKYLEERIKVLNKKYS